jgi:hypothetical protein
MRKKEKYISLNDYNDGYKVRITLGKITAVRQRVFAFQSFGNSKEETMKAAVEWRDEVLKEMNLTLTKASRKVTHGDKDEDLIGLILVVLKNGSLHWRATLGGDSKYGANKQFAVGRFGYDEAYHMARRLREEVSGRKLRETPPTIEEALRRYNKVERSKVEIPAESVFTGHKTSDLDGISLLWRTNTHGFQSLVWYAYLGSRPNGSPITRGFSTIKYGYNGGYLMARDARVAFDPSVEYRESAPDIEELIELAMKSVRRKGSWKNKPHSLLSDGVVQAARALQEKERIDQLNGVKK